MTIAAYDYQQQCWIEGEDARQLLLSQIREDIALLTSDRGNEYARFINSNRDELLSRRLTELASLEAQNQTPEN